MRETAVGDVWTWGISNPEKIAGLLFLPCAAIVPYIGTRSLFVFDWVDRSGMLAVGVAKLFMLPKETSGNAPCWTGISCAAMATGEEICSVMLMGLPLT